MHASVKRKKTSKALVVIIALTMLLSLMPSAAWAEPIDGAKIESAGSNEELSKKVSAADSEPYFEIDVSQKSVSLATEEITDEVTDIIAESGSASSKQDKVVDALEESGLYTAEAEGKSKVEVSSIYANRRILLFAKKSDDIDTFDAEEAAYYNGQYLLSYNDEEETKTAYEALCNKYGEENVLLDAVAKIDAQSWGTEYMNMDAEKEKAASGKAVTVAVLDTGINRTHELFAGRDILAGYDYVNSDSDPADDHGHGTAIAGIIAESTPANVKILPIKVTSASGSASLINLLYGLQYAADNGADIINLSMGLYAKDKAAFNNYAYYFRQYAGNSDDLVIVCAAGNDSKDLDASGVYDFPGELPETINVSAVDMNGSICDFSNYGSAIDFGAPGYGVIGASSTNDSGYHPVSGTSFAAPHVAAACALVKAESGGNREDVIDALADISEDLGTEGKDVYYGNGCPVFTKDSGSAGTEPGQDTEPNTDPQPGLTDISQAEISNVENKEYTGSPITQSPVIKVNGTVLTEGSDYQLSYDKNVNAGTAVMTVTGTGSYTGSKTVEFTIIAKATSPTVELSQTTFIYDGSVKTPGVTVKSGETVLTEGTDYEVTYPAGRRDVGEYTISVTLKGNYSGSGSAKFVITESSEEPVVSLSQSSFTYDGTEKTPAVTVKAGDTVLVKETDYTLTYSEGRVNTGQYNVTVKLKGNYSGTITKKFEIKPKKTTPVVSLSETTYTYDGSVKSPRAAVKDGDTALTEGKDYILIYPQGREDAGTYVVTATLKGNYEGYGRKEFVINPRAISPQVSLDRNAYIYDGTAKTPSPIVKYGNRTVTDYSISYPSGRTEAGAYRVTVNLRGNYTGSGSATFAIYKKSSPVTASAKTATVKYKNVKKKAQTVKPAKLMTVRNRKGRLRYTLISVKNARYKKYFKVNPNTGTVTVKKKCKKGTYTLRIHVTDSGDNNHSMTTRAVNCKIRVK